MKPNPQTYNPNPDYLRELIARAGVSQREAARRIGVTERAMRFWLTGRPEIPYTAQFALESLSEPLGAWIEKALPYLETERQIPDVLYWELRTLLGKPPA